MALSKATKEKISKGVKRTNKARKKYVREHGNLRGWKPHLKKVNKVRRRKEVEVIKPKETKKFKKAKKYLKGRKVTKKFKSKEKRIKTAGEKGLSIITSKKLQVLITRETELKDWFQTKREIIKKWAEKLRKKRSKTFKDRRINYEFVEVKLDKAGNIESESQFTFGTENVDQSFETEELMKFIDDQLINLVASVNASANLFILIYGWHYTMSKRIVERVTPKKRGQRGKNKKGKRKNNNNRGAKGKKKSSKTKKRKRK